MLELLPFHSQADRETMKIFLPLCGKSGDLIHLYNLGHSVLGLEGVHYVAESAFKDNGLDFTKTRVPEIDGFRLATPDGRLVIYACDLFRMTPEVLGPVDTIFDRGSFEAILEVDRPKYVALMKAVLAPKFRIVLNGYEYDNSKFPGPPRHVDRRVVQELYGMLEKAFFSKLTVKAIKVLFSQVSLRQWRSWRRVMLGREPKFSVWTR